LRVVTVAAGSRKMRRPQWMQCMGHAAFLAVRSGGATLPRTYR